MTHDVLLIIFLVNSYGKQAWHMADIIGIIGTGTMGNGIAYVAASHGHEVIMYDVQLALAQRGLDRIRATLLRHVEKKRISADEMQATLERVQLTTDLADMARAA